MNKSTRLLLFATLPILVLTLVFASSVLAVATSPATKIVVKDPPETKPEPSPEPPVEAPIYVALSLEEAAAALAAAAGALPEGTQACGAFSSNTHGWVFLQIGDFSDCAGKDPVHIVCDDGAGNFSALNASSVQLTADGNIKFKSSQHGTCVIAG